MNEMFEEEAKKCKNKGLYISKSQLHRQISFSASENVVFVLITVQNFPNGSSAWSTKHKSFKNEIIRACWGAQQLSHLSKGTDWIFERDEFRITFRKQVVHLMSKS